MTEAFRLAELTTDEVRDEVRNSPTAVLLPVGSVEPHGPHLPLATDTILSEEAARRAAKDLRARGVRAWIAPSVPYGVTDFAAGFHGAVGIGASVLTPLLAALVTGFLDNGFSHVCLVNNHLEPAHDQAVRAAIDRLSDGMASVACPLSKRWGRLLSDEFKRGNCHAGRYETSLVLAAGVHPRDGFLALPPLQVSLSDGIRQGKTSFRAMGLDRAYTGAPGDATREEGEALYARLAEMIATEVLESLAKVTLPARPVK